MRIHGKEITTIISDLDGTLLGQGTKLDANIFPVIRQLWERGVSFVAASGRQYRNMRLLFEPITDEIPFICENGSMIVEHGKTIYAKNIPRDLCFELIDDLLGMPDTEMIVSSERDLYTLASREKFVAFMNRVFQPEVSTIEDYRMITGDINKISAWWSNGIPEKEAGWLREKYDDRLLATDSGNGWFDFTLRGVDKGVALRELAAVKGFSLEETLCFGDSENDIAMFHECAVSYAMETAKPHVLEEADYVCSNVKETLLAFLGTGL